MAGRRMPVVKDRRSSLRVEVEGRARIHTERDAFDGRCIDLGLGGIAIRSARATRPGQLVTLEARFSGQSLRVGARLVRRQRVEGDYLLGFAFVGVDLDTQRRIEHLMFERLAESPLAGFMRAFVAHGERRNERTVVAGTLLVPVISGHTQVIAVSDLVPADRTVIAPPPPRPDTVIARPSAAPPSALAGEIHASPPVTTSAHSPGVPDDAWLDDEMDTAQFRLLEAAQAREGAEQDVEDVEDDEGLALLEPDEAAPEHTVVVGGFATARLREHTQVTGDAAAAPSRERTLVTGEAPERSPREHTQVTFDASEQPLRERTLVTIDAPEPLLRERTLVTADAFERSLVERTLVTSDAPEPPRERTVVTSDAPEPPRERTVVTADAAERTVPFLRDFLDRAHVASSGPARGPGEHTALVSARVEVDASASPTQRALLDATALLQGSARGGKRGPRVVVSVAHRTYRRIASTPWNDR